MISTGGRRIQFFSKSSNWRATQTEQKRRRRSAGAAPSAGTSLPPSLFLKSTDATVAGKETLPSIPGRLLTVAGSDVIVNYLAALTNALSSAILDLAHLVLRQCNRLATVASLLLSPGDARRQPGLAVRSVEEGLVVAHTFALPLVTQENVPRVSEPPSRAVNARRRKNQDNAPHLSLSVVTLVELFFPVAFTIVTTFATLQALAHPVLFLWTDTVHVASL